MVLLITNSIIIKGGFLVARICENCGAKNDDNASFCDSCGVEFVQEPLNNDTPIKTSNEPGRTVLLSVIIILAVVGVVAFASWNWMISPSLNDNYLDQNGINGTAEILDAKQTQTYVNNNPEIKFKLLVTIPGKDPYQANYTTVVAYIDLAKVQPGNKWYVLVDPKNPQNLKFA
jgi:hypothetical protein